MCSFCYWNAKDAVLVCLIVCFCWKPNSLSTLLFFPLSVAKGTVITSLLHLWVNLCLQRQSGAAASAVSGACRAAGACTINLACTGSHQTCCIFTVQLLSVCSVGLAQLVRAILCRAPFIWGLRDWHDPCLKPALSDLIESSTPKRPGWLKELNSHWSSGALI